MSAKTNSRISVSTFFAKSHPSDVCGSNGLPLTPNSIAIFGRSQFLKSEEIKHDNLCEYLDVVRGKHERTIIVSEHDGVHLESVSLREDSRMETILKISFQILLALDHLNQNGLVCRNLEPSNVLVDNNHFIKLYNYGLYYMTNNGQYVSFPIGNVKYLAPESILGSRENPKNDTWSLGIMLVELVFKCKIWANLKTSQIIRKILSLCNTQNVLEKIAREHNFYEDYQKTDEEIKEFISKCLSISLITRPVPKDLLEASIFDDIRMNKIEKEELTDRSFVEKYCTLGEIYYLWQLAGGDVHQELKKEGLIKSEAPILSMPNLVLLNGKAIAPPKSQSFLYDERIIFLNLNNLIERLSKIPEEDYLPLIYTTDSYLESAIFKTELPLVIREKDTVYQFYRIMLMKTLLTGYPYTQDLVRDFACKDIPPPLRGRIWACLLGVLENDAYEKYDKSTPTSTDRQIEVDIPRCHQYNELLSSPEGHNKLKRLLKAWVTAHPQYVYWQGLDSLTAPFLYLNFNNESRAFLSLHKFIPKYLHQFFLKDNSPIIKEYLVKFFQLIVFHEPVLAKHLYDINFIPELYAIPWFLTMFSHVFPLHKIFHLWDKLILGDSSYPLFIGIAILKQLKNTLLKSGFNECILLFSDLPDIVMESCVNDSEKMYSFTPKSITCRKYALKEEEPGDYDLNYTDECYKDVQKELCARLSVNDFIKLLRDSPRNVIILDIRNNLEFKKISIENSINIPFTSVSLNELKLDVLNTPNLEAVLKKKDKISIIISSSNENAVLFSKFLVDCHICHVCVLNNGFESIYSPGHKLVLQTFDYINTLAKNLQCI